MSYAEVEQHRLMLAALRQLLESQELVPMLREAQIVAPIVGEVVKRGLDL